MRNFCGNILWKSRQWTLASWIARVQYRWAWFRQKTTSYIYKRYKRKCHHKTPRSCSLLRFCTRPGKKHLRDEFYDFLNAVQSNQEMTGKSREHLLKNLGYFWEKPKLPNTIMTRIYPWDDFSWLLILNANIWLSKDARPQNTMRAQNSLHISRHH